MATTVANIRNCPAGWQSDRKYVYIGRPGKGLSGYYGNPIMLRNEADREEVLHQYYDYAAKRIHEDPKFAAMVLALEGKTLVCFCAPKACHGDVLVLLIDYLKTVTK